MKELVKKLLSEASYRKVLHGIVSGCRSVDELQQKLNLDKNTIEKIVEELKEKGVIEINEEGIKSRLQDFLLVIDFRTGSVYAVFSPEKAREIREYIAKHL
ncbi:MAG: hypothetical protein GXO42_00190 [bacterium]|nr:hypothetical protein [bacterium]